MNRLFPVLLFSLFTTCYFGNSVLGDSQEGSFITGSEALNLLKEGNSRFVQRKAKALALDSAFLEALSKRQRPFAIVLSCSDSRVPPEIVFNQGLGDIFAIRVAGEVLDASTVASIEYAVEYVGAHLLVVLGHESCGAVEAALKAHPARSAGSADLDSLLASVYLEAKRGHLESITATDPLLRKPVMYHVDQVASGLASRSTIIQKHLENGSLKVVRAIYSLKSGEVQFWNEGELR